ncbi:MAG: penicillin-binding protein 2 [Gammaproteobacteria bacterium]|uniref:Peptidoglycan D,D-transpeptidase MrdA n=1 Tax=OM182 bacterium MED-G24 TaxID=1986255 RepID=A0A2A5WSG0_9GAMM|nr:penicillin-binding protein 2 [Gammaproteobacteria bacterium]PDH39429.1 MAG: penicillin-binding protein 2 [OM182 bacterium MED-G24]|tara:strand:+ start:3357 stop:5267 length:1911 start_codon:yes stop_codon:yes gene_type:complete
MSEPVVLKDHHDESRVFVDRVVIAFGISLLLTTLLGGRMLYLQVIQHDRYATMSESNRIQVQSIPPVRGLIVDRHGELLADNRPSFSLTLVTEQIDSVEDILDRIEERIGLTEEQRSRFEHRRKRKQRPYESVPLLHRLSQEEIARISVDQYAMPGVHIEASLVRHYPLSDLVTHAVGSVRRINEEDALTVDKVSYSGTDHIGKTGVERFYESRLLGRVGYQRVETDARGRIMQVLSRTDPIPGENLTLTLDAGLQKVASDALGDQRGAIVAMDTRTGGILALLSKPAYDPNPFVTGIDHASYALLRDSVDVPLFNRAIQGQYEPGSTLKPFIGLAGLTTGVTTADYVIDDPGWFQLPDNQRLYRDWNWTREDEGGHGEVDMNRAIYRSCNVYFYNLAAQLGIDRIHSHLDRFGFGRNLAHDLPEAGNGLLPSREWKHSARNLPWYPGDSVNIGIGQGDVLVTPLQLVTAIAGLANRGRLVTPHLLKDADVPAPPNVDIPDHAWNVISEAMQDVIHRGNRGLGENGTAWAYIGLDIPYRAAGKSGTAQVVGIAQGEEYDDAELDERLRKHAWFVAYAPADEPEIAVAVLVENGGGGSSVAAPVARKVLDYQMVGNSAVATRSERSVRFVLQAGDPS